jgi:uncharacterized protein
MTDTHDAPTDVTDAPVSGGAPVALLSFEEARVLGCLLEKERTTPAEYPMTANALMRACNQSTSRTPVVSFDERTVDAALVAMKPRGLVRFVHSQSNRATKYRQVADEAWGLGAEELAVLCVLLLRGPQTPGELRTRTERLHPFDTPQAIEQVLVVLSQRPDPFVRELERGPGQKEQRWVQLLTGEPSDADLAVGSAAGSRVVRGGPDPALLERLDAQEQRIVQLEAHVEHLRRLLEDLVGPIEP